LATVQKSLVEYDARYAAFLVPQGTFHITLSLLAIANEQEAETAVRVMQENAVRMQQLILGAGEEEAGSSSASSASASASGAVSLSSRGLSSFSDKVLFADVARDSARARLNRVALLLTSAFESAGISWNREEEARSPSENNGFVPHLTIAKMPMQAAAGEVEAKDPAAGSSVIRHIDSQSYIPMVAHDFGTQIIGQIELCSMGGRKKEDGYYFVRGNVQLQPQAQPQAQFDAATGGE
jgi:2'-5' RNA ligase